MYKADSDQPLCMDSTCGSLLCELQAYRRKVDHASKSRAQLRQAVADAEAELAHICSALGERPVHIKHTIGSLKKDLEAITPQLEEMRKRKNERRDQFVEVLGQIRNILKELCRLLEENLHTTVIDESDLSLRKLEELRAQLVALKNEKLQDLATAMVEL